MEYFIALRRQGLVILLCLAIHSALSAASAINLTPCSTLSFALPGKVFSQGNAAYNSSIQSYYSAQEESIMPTCVFRPTSTGDVSEAVAILSGFHLAQPTKGLFAVRGGGHGIFAGYANIADGVTMDLSYMNSTTFMRSDKSVVGIGPGARWTAVYKILDPYKLTVVGGRTGSIGAGGYLTGGGLSFLSQRHGWACDASNTIGYEVVLAGGLVVYADATGPYSDLFMALKGGSNNFGVVTRFDMTTYSQGDLWGGFLLYPFNYTVPMLSAYSGFMSPNNYDHDADMVFAIGYFNPGWVPILNLGLQYTKPVVDPPVFQPLYNPSIAESNTMRITNLTDIVTEEDEHNPYGNRQLYMTATFAHYPGIYTQIYSLFNSTTSAVSSVPNIGYFLIFQPSPILNGTNSLGLAASDVRVNIALIAVSWSNAEDDTLVTNTVNSFFQKMNALTTKYGVYREYQYLNYASSSQKPLDSYGAVNKARLQEVSRKYDPLRLFQTGVPGGFKLFS